MASRRVPIGARPVIRTPVCDLLGITVPVVAAPFGPWEQVDLAAAVSRAGGLGSLGTALCSPDELRDRLRRLRSLTDRPFAVNHQTRPFDEPAFAATVAARPRVISFHMGVPADLVARAHDAGILWMQQVMDRRQAEDALAAGADVIIAQGGEAGGHGGGGWTPGPGTPARPPPRGAPGRGPGGGPRGAGPPPAPPPPAPGGRHGRPPL